MRKIAPFIVMVAVIAMATLLLAGPQRIQTWQARDTSLIPSGDACLTKLTISDDLDHTVDLSGLPFQPLILQVRADGNFHEGSSAPVQSNDPWRDSGLLWSIPVNGRLTWHFMRQQGAGTVNIYIKALGSY